MNGIYIIIAIIIIFAVAIVLAKSTPKRKNTRQRQIYNQQIPQPTAVKPQWDLSMYFLKGSILTDTELRFYQKIKDIVPQEYIIAPKVGLKDFVNIKARKDYMKHFGHISQKHIDFLVCRKSNFSPVLGIELDDLSHKQTNRIERDNMVDAIYNKIGLQILHVPTNATDIAIRNILTEILVPKEKAETPPTVTQAEPEQAATV